MILTQRLPSLQDSDNTHHDERARRPVGGVIRRAATELRHEIAEKVSYHDAGLRLPLSGQPKLPSVVLRARDHRKIPKGQLPVRQALHVGAAESPPLPALRICVVLPQVHPLPSDHWAQSATRKIRAIILTNHSEFLHSLRGRSRNRRFCYGALKQHKMSNRL